MPGRSPAPGHLGVPIGPDPGSLLAAGRVLVEFTAPEPTLEHLRLAAARGAGAVVGTTGLQAAQVDEVRRLAARVPIMLSPNMSVGVNLAFRVLALMAKALGDDYDVEITEIHHRMKKDAPSGTAAKMAEVIAEALGRRIEDAGVYGRHGLVGERTHEGDRGPRPPGGRRRRGAHGRLRHGRRAARADPPGPQPRYLRPRGAPGNPVRRDRPPRPLLDARRPGALSGGRRTP